MTSNTMKAVQVQRYNELYRVSEVTIPQPQPHQVLVRIKAAAFCHTDLTALNGEFNTALPFIGSHESGDRVGCINFDSACGKCPDCQANRPVYCDAPRMKGITTDGAWAEYMVACLQWILIRGQGYTVATIDIKQAALDAVASYRHSPDALVLATDPVGTSLFKIDAVVSSQYRGVDATVLATDHPAAFDLAAALTRKHGRMAQALVGLLHENQLHVEVKEWTLDQAETMKSEYLTGAGTGKSVVVVFD
ncbi:zinc binding dehydrogenase [Penicillium capsulatum]|uniref:Zinc binding dehydrogenase n=1 Tax=Penicillium capsulatum TaxID=69766 RepID=A0A9W9LUN2_9EURO|nr:zinc binding dehydrogenase [Penicillium capsulatum]KAJ6123434.1 zinc binding dehydrogenase [Penicillium capsulatum]